MRRSLSPIWLAALPLAFLYGVAALDSAPEEQRAEARPGSEQVSERPSAALLADAEIHGKVQNHEAAETQESAPNGLSYWIARPSITDWLLATFTFVLVLFTWRQMGDSRSVQRAFVYLKQIDSLPLPPVLKVMPKWVNGGATQTKGLRNYISWKSFDGDIPADFDFPDLDQSGAPVADGAAAGIPLFLAPKAEVFGQFCDIPIALLAQAFMGEKRIFVWGRAEYRDVFAGTPDRVTKFCNELNIGAFTQDDAGQVTLAISFPIYRRHNCADDECG